MSNFLVLVSVLFLVSCSFFKRNESRQSLAIKSKKNFELKDKTGTFIVERETGLQTKSRYITKYRVKDSVSHKILEQNVLISSAGILKGKQSVLRPFRSQYMVWFDQKKYQVETNINPLKKVMEIEMNSPETQWQGGKSFRFPSGSGVYCYFSQVMECISFTGFISKAIEKNTGKMNFHILFDGFPYFHEQYLNIPEGLFAAAELVYDGNNKNGERRFSLKFGGTSIFYFLDNKNNLIKMFWPNQGLSMVAI